MLGRIHEPLRWDILWQVLAELHTVLVLAPASLDNSEYNRSRRT